MLSAELPHNEVQRQQALERQDLLDTPADPYLDTLTRIARELFAVKTVLISLIDNDRQWFMSRQGLELAETPRCISFCAHAILQDDALVIEDTHLDFRFADNPVVLQSPFIRFYAGQPLHDEDGQTLGTLCLIDPQPRGLDARERRQLRDMAQLVEGYLRLRHSSRQAEQLRAALSRAQRKAMLDALTQLWNRAGLLHFLPQQQAAAERAGLRLGLLFCDLDHFKQVNDRHGHAAGDQVLWQSARRLSAAVRPQDVVARNGGEEFVILALVHDRAELLQIAERIRLAIAEPAMELDGAQLSQTASVGCALLAPGETTADALERADQALYRAKRGGRNRCEFAATDQ
ncbi:sensor domain-containing diguanylate cyclase [Pseudomonas sp. CW003PS]|nr:sensor domain-containing diguanylate cyclase [Pseudomonas sp. CW003PS]